MVACLIASVLASWNFLRDDVVQSDVLVHHYWMRSFQDPELFNDGLTSLLRESGRYPEGYQALFRLASNVVDPVVFGEWLGIGLMAASGWLLFLVVREHTDWKVAAWLAAALFLALSDIHRFYGGFPRAFVQVAVLLTVLLTIRRHPLAAALAASGAALFYPPAALLSVGVLVLTVFEWKGWRPRLDRRRAGFAVMAVVVMFGLILGPPALSGAGSSDVFTEAQARQYPEFGEWGPLHFFTKSNIQYFKQNRSGFDLGSSGSIIALAALALLLVRPLNLRLVRPEVLALAVAALGAYTVAQFVLFKLYLPHRYTYPLLAFFAIAIAVSIKPTWEGLSRRRASRTLAFALLLAPLPLYYFAVHVFPLGPAKPVDGLASETTYIGVAAAVVLAAAGALLIQRLPPGERVAYGAAVSGVTLVAVLLSLPDRQPMGERCPEVAATQYMQTLPKDAVIAGDPYDMNCLPFSAQRPVVMSTKLVMSYEPDYFLKSRERMLTLLEAFYGQSPRAIGALNASYGATHLWVRRDAVLREVMRDGEVRWRTWRMRPYGKEVVHGVRRGPLAVLRLPRACRTWVNKTNEIYDIRCIAASEVPEKAKA